MIHPSLYRNPVMLDARAHRDLKVARTTDDWSVVQGINAIAVAALEFADELQAQVDLLRSERDALAAWLADQGFVVAPSDANFILFGMFDDRPAVWQRLLDQGVLVRQTGPSGWLRVSVGTPQENAMFRQALLTAREG